MYNIEVIEEKKVVYIVTGGLLKRDEGLIILNELKKTFRRLNTSQYYLILDSTDFKAVFQDDLDILHEVIVLYERTPFIKKFFILPKSTIAQKQAQKIDNTKLPSYLIEVSSFDEALSLM